MGSGCIISPNKSKNTEMKKAEQITLTYDQAKLLKEALFLGLNSQYSRAKCLSDKGEDGFNNDLESEAALISLGSEIIDKLEPGEDLEITPDLANTLTYLLGNGISAFDDEIKLHQKNAAVSLSNDKEVDKASLTAMVFLIKNKCS
jgi:hypothetical protein